MFVILPIVELKDAVASSDQQLQVAEQMKIELDQSTAQISQLRLALKEGVNETLIERQRVTETEGLMERLQKESQLRETDLKLKVTRLEQLLLSE